MSLSDQKKETRRDCVRAGRRLPFPTPVLTGSGSRVYDLSLVSDELVKRENSVKSQAFATPKDDDILTRLLSRVMIGRVTARMANKRARYGHRLNSSGCQPSYHLSS